MLRPPYLRAYPKREVACTLVKVHARPWALPWNFHGPRRLFKGDVVRNSNSLDISFSLPRLVFILSFYAPRNACASHPMIRLRTWYGIIIPLGSEDTS